MNAHFSDHPSAQLLESYSLEELPGSDLPALEEHLLVCEHCRQVVCELDVFAPALRGWGRKRNSAAFVHDTDDGRIWLELRALPDAKWAARFWGDTLEGSAVFQDVRDAYAHLRSVFSQMYPDHQCTSGCGAPE